MVLGAFADKPFNLITPVTISTQEQEKKCVNIHTLVFSNCFVKEVILKKDWKVKY